MQEEKKINFVFDINSHLQNQIKNIKYIKYATVTATIVGLILAVGFASKVITYAIGNIKTLSQTLKK